MLTVHLDHTHRSALIRQDPGHRVTVNALRQPEATAPEPPRRRWIYAAFDPEVGVFTRAEPDLSLFARDTGLKPRTRAQIESAGLAIERSDMPIALLRWEYREVPDDNVLACVPVDFYLPLPPAQAQEPGAPRATIGQAQEARLTGWNLRCNRCGGWGASWYPGERPGWGSAALCRVHAGELHDEHSRHNEVLEVLRAVSFEQSADVSSTHGGRRAGLPGAPVAVAPARYDDVS